MRFSLLLLCAFSTLVQAEWHETFKAGDRVFDSRNYQAGTVINNVEAGHLEVKLDKKSKIKIYNNYYAAELGPKIELCNTTLCVGDKFTYTIPVIGKNRQGEVVEIFQGSDGYTDTNKYGKVIFAVLLENENEIRFLNSDHLQYLEH